MAWFKRGGVAEEEPEENRSVVIDTAGMMRMLEFQAFEKEMQPIIDNPPEKLSPQAIDEQAKFERAKRLATLANTSKTQLVPSPSAHAHINHILDEMESYDESR